jgi:hypothetical protein
MENPSHRPDDAVAWSTIAVIHSASGIRATRRNQGHLLELHD